MRIVFTLGFHPIADTWTAWTTVQAKNICRFEPAFGAARRTSQIMAEKLGHARLHAIMSAL
jgi:hypothetical protein